MLKLGIHKEAFLNAPTATAKYGSEYVYLHIYTNKLRMILSQDREVTARASLQEAKK